MENKKVFVVIGGLWRDKVNGNTYHASKIIDAETNTTYYSPYQYGYGRQYIRSAEQYITEELKITNFSIIDAGSYPVKKIEAKRGQF